MVLSVRNFGLEVKSLNQQQSPGDREPKCGSVFAIAEIQSTIESVSCGLTLAKRRYSGKEQRDGAPVNLVFLTKELRHCRRFDAHNRQIDAKKQGGEKQAQDKAA